MSTIQMACFYHHPAGKKGDVGKNSEIVAGASTYNDMRVGADAPNNGAGGIRTPVP